MRFSSAVLLVCLLAPGIGEARKKKKAATAQDFSYYLLTLSYAPDFCDQPEGRKDPRECGAGRHVGFVVHGLWPQGEDSRGPQNCSPARPVSQAILQATLKYIPTESLIQHEWATHGTCSGLSATEYFAALRKARDSVHLPPELDQPSRKLQLTPAEIEAKIATANPNFPKEAIRTSCYRDEELQEIRICLNTGSLAAACGPSAGECRAGKVTILPVK